MYRHTGQRTIHINNTYKYSIVICNCLWTHHYNKHVIIYERAKTKKYDDDTSVKRERTWKLL